MISSGHDGMWAKWSNRSDAVTFALVFIGCAIGFAVRCIQDITASNLSPALWELLGALLCGVFGLFYALGLSIWTGPTGVHMRTGVFTRHIAWDEIATFGFTSMGKAECFMVMTVDRKVRRGPFFANGRRSEVREFYELLNRQLAYVRQYGVTSSEPKR